MSQQDNPQDTQENLPTDAAGSWSTPPASNRPAEGANRVASLGEAEKTWNSGDGATDFLGLEQDVAADAPLLAPAQAAEGAGAAEINPTQAWLFHMESEARTAIESQAQVAEDAPSAEWSAESLVEGQDTTPSAEESESADAPMAVEVLPEGESATELPAPAPLPGRRRKVQWLVAAGLVATLLAAGGWQVWHGSSKTQTPGDPLAWRSGSSKTPKPQPKPAPTIEKPASETPTVAQTPPGESPAASTPAESAPVSVAQTNPDPQPKPADTQAPPADIAAAVVPDAQPADTNPQPTEPAPLDYSPVAFPGAHPGDVASTIATPKGARRPDASEIAGLWVSPSIPFDAISAESVTRTPRVGAVRVLLKNGEHLQGRLHSVGQGQVSMDVSLGRMSVDYSDVSEIVQIQEADLSKKPSNGLPSETAGLMYVTAKVAGGYLTGWLVQRSEGKLTLITEQAKKITIEDDGFEPVSKGRARVVGTVGRSATEAGSPLPEPERANPKLQKNAPAAKAPAAKAPAKAPKPRN